MSATLLDEILPVFDVRSRHEILVAAPAAAVARAVEDYRLDVVGPAPVRLLFRLRGLRVPSGRLRDSMMGAGFSILAETPNEEIVAGVAGRFWAPREMANMFTLGSAAEFIDFDRPGTAKAAVSIRVEPRGKALTRLSTETRVSCADPRAKRRFIAYWTLIRLPSGWIRRAVLGGIKRKAEAFVQSREDIS